MHTHNVEGFLCIAYVQGAQLPEVRGVFLDFSVLAQEKSASPPTTLRRLTLAEKRTQGYEVVLDVLHSNRRNIFRAFSRRKS